MAGTTHYGTLGIVAAVAMVAIIAMSLGISERPLDAAVEPTFVESFGITGHSVRSGPVDTGQGDHDLNGDDRLDASDSSILSDVIDGRRCPSKKDCDLDNSGLTDVRDLGLLNAIVLRTPPVEEPVARAFVPALSSAAPGALA